MIEILKITVLYTISISAARKLCVLLFLHSRTAICLIIASWLSCGRHPLSELH